MVAPAPISLDESENNNNNSWRDSSFSCVVTLSQKNDWLKWPCNTLLFNLIYVVPIAVILRIWLLYYMYCNMASTSSFGCVFLPTCMFLLYLQFLRPWHFMEQLSKYYFDAMQVTLRSKVSWLKIGKNANKNH